MTLSGEWGLLHTNVNLQKPMRKENNQAAGREVNAKKRKET